MCSVDDEVSQGKHRGSGPVPEEQALGAAAGLMLVSVAGAPVMFLGGVIGNSAIVWVGFTVTLVGVLAAIATAIVISRRSGSRIGRSLLTGVRSAWRWLRNVG